MLHFGLPAADIIADPTQPFALSQLHAAGGVDRQSSRRAVKCGRRSWLTGCANEQRFERSVTGDV
jgi:hypothetical protein